MISNYKVKVNDSCNYKVSITDIQNKYKFKLFCAGADLTDYYTKEQVDQSQNTQDILIDNILNQIPTGTATGETINITDSSSLPLKDIQVAGNTYQETTTGKNLFDKDNANTINAYVNSTNNKIVATGEGTGCFYIPCEANTTYTVSKTELFGNDRFCVFDTARIPTAGDTILSFVGKKSGVDTNTSYTITTTATATYLGVFVKANVTNPAKTMQEIAETIQIEKNSSATSYEKYTGGNPAPNPDYPQTISNVTGTNTIKIVGKNLFDKNNANILKTFINASGVITSDNNSRSIYIQCKPNTTYTIQKILTTRFRVGYSSDTPVIGITLNGVISNYDGTTITITTGNNTKYLVVWICNIDTATLQEVLDSIQIEESSTVTTYEAYKEQNYTINLGDIELCKIGDYKDRIYQDEGTWYIEKNTEKINLGDLTWLFNTTSTTPTNRTVLRIDNNPKIENYLSNIFLSSQQNDTTISNRFVTNTGSGTIISWYVSLEDSLTGVSSSDTDNEKLNKVKTYLQNNNIYAILPLSTPTTTEITDTTLVGQLDTLLNSTTYKTTTNIMVDTTNQKPTLTLTYRKDLETLIGG